MQTALRKMGNSTGIILPKPILTALGLGSGATLELEVADGRVIATPVKHAIRQGWEEAAKVIGGCPLTKKDRDWLDADRDADADWQW